MYAVANNNPTISGNIYSALTYISPSGDLVVSWGPAAAQIIGSYTFTGVNPHGAFYAVSGSLYYNQTYPASDPGGTQNYLINSTTGAATAVAQVVPDFYVKQVTPDGTTFGINTPGTVYIVDPSGAFITTSYTRSDIYGTETMAFDSVNNILYIISKGAYYYSGAIVNVIQLIATIATPSISLLSLTPVSIAGTTVAQSAVTDAGLSAVITRGVCYNTTGTPTLADTVLPNGSGPGTYVTTVPSLSQSKIYYFRAYATNSYGTVYSNQINTNYLYLQWQTWAPRSPNRLLYDLFSSLSSRWYPTNIISNDIEYAILSAYANELSSASIATGQVINDLSLNTVRTTTVGTQTTSKMYDNFGAVVGVNKYFNQDYDTYTAGTVDLMPYRQELRFLYLASFAGSTDAGLQLAGQAFTGIAPLFFQELDNYPGWTLGKYTGSVLAVGNNFIVIDQNIPSIGCILPVDIAS